MNYETVMNYETLLRDLVRAIEYQEPTGFFWHVGGGTFCPAGCREGDIFVFSDHRPNCPYRLAVEAIDQASLKEDQTALKENQNQQAENQNQQAE